MDRIQLETICALVGTEVIETNSGLRHDFMGIGRRHLSKIKRIFHDKMMNTVSTAKVETEQLERPQQPMVHYLGLL